MSTASSVGAGPAPIPFITQDPRNPAHFVIDPAARRLLSAIKGRICPVVVAGPYRSGKSMLLNLLLPPSSSSVRRPGFAVGNTVQACTKGIWLWGEPIHVKETNKTILFLDSEGLGAVGAQATFDVQIFSLSILLSSLFILNTFGNINENALEQLELVVQMTERVRVNQPQQTTSALSSRRGPASAASSSSSEDLSLLAAHFPDFLWVLRDFSLQLEDTSGSPITPREYLEQALQPVSGSRSAEKNRIRHVLSTVFPSRDVVPLVRPVADEKQLQRLDRLAEREMRPEFIAQLSRLRHRVYEEAREKRVEGMLVTGGAYLALADSYVRAMNAGGVPVIHSAWTSVVELQGRQGKEEAIRVFNQQLKQAAATLLTREELLQAAVKAKAEAMRVLSEYAVGDAIQVDQLRQQVEGQAEEALQQTAEMNAIRSKEHNRTAWNAAWKRAGGDQLLNSAEMEEKQWIELGAKVTREYEKAAKGEAREDVGRQLLSEKREQLMQRVMEQRQQERKETERLKAQKEATEKRASDTEKELSQLQMELRYEKERLQSEGKKAEEERKRAEDRSRVLEGQLKEMEREEKRTRKEHEAELEEVRAKHRKAEAELKRLQDQSEYEQKQRNNEKAALLKERKQAEEEREERYRRELERSEQEAKLSTRRAEEELAQTSRTERELRQQLQRAEADRDRLLEEVKEAKVGQKGLKAAKERLQEREDESVELRRQVEKALKEKQFYADRSHREAEAVEEVRAEMKRVERQNASLEAELKKLREEEDQNNQQMEDRIKRLAELKEENETLRAGLLEERMLRLAAHQALEKSKKRRRQEEKGEEDEEKDEDAEMDAVDNEDYSSSHHAPPPRVSTSRSYPHPARFPPPFNALTNAQLSKAPPVRRSLAPTRVSVSPQAANSELNRSTDPVDPDSLSIAQLKSWLTELDVDLPSRSEKKAFYVDLIYKQLPELEEFFPRVANGGGKKGRKGK